MPKESFTQSMADALAGPMGGARLWDVLMQRLVTKNLGPDVLRDHPKGDRHGSVESLIKLLGAKAGTLIGADAPYLEQYLHPSRDVLTKIPTPAGGDPSIQYREPEYYDPGDYSDVAPLNPQGPGLKIANTEGLGSFRTPTPETIEDVWDFESTAPMTEDWTQIDPRGLTSTLIKRFLSSSGTPFGIAGPREKHEIPTK